ncbi:GNAT family N-acetyltransferase [Limnovirga soli]|uniref:GNAT family N-acetyltransferase n=1 Tax=Limnovirga soli TaxID=2656915 RepID=A0A8J8FEK4_9BACT|nr:GNAT family N-acetyltransferase [Limnovirga soli]NNV56651.1 GNAT family N-acetyltransferase [Limnovirga soli]
MPITIRRACLDDIDKITPLFNAYRIFYGQPADMEGALAFITARLTLNESVIFIAFDNETAVGFTQLYPIFSSVSMQRAWLLNDLFVHTAARGKGAGTALLNAAKTFGRDTQSKWLLLETAPDNTKAQALYEQNGWIKSDEFFYTFGL